MSETDNYGLLSETSGIEETRDPARQRHLPVSVVFSWLGAGWRDFAARPMSSLGYGVLVFAVSVILIYLMLTTGWDYILLPALSGFMIVAPVLAIGLYEKSRRIELGMPASIIDMILVRSRSDAQVLFAGVLLMLLMLLWTRAAVLLYALFFGYRAFPGAGNMIPLLLGTPTGWGLLTVGTLVGGLFASFAFAISVFSIPMLLHERTDAFTAMALSFKMVWNNVWTMIAWGAVVLALCVLSLATGLLALIVVFPVLGHATWHAYRTMR